MSDVSRINDLIAEAREHTEQPGSPNINDGQGYCGRCSRNWPCVTSQLAVALEAAIRVPVHGESRVYLHHEDGTPKSNDEMRHEAATLRADAAQGEPNDDREALADRLARVLDGNGGDDLGLSRGEGALHLALDFPIREAIEDVYADCGDSDSRVLSTNIAQRLAYLLPTALLTAFPSLSRATVSDAREHLHAKCDCVPDLGPAHCHLCGNAKDSPVPWTECEAVAVPDAAKTIAELKDYSMRTVDHGLKVIEQRDAALAAVDRVRAIHQKKEADAVTGDCATEDCEHVDKCPTQVFEVCIACWNLCEESDPYFGERGISAVLWPCTTRAALDGAPEPEQEYRVEYQVPGGATHVTETVATFEEAHGSMLGNIHGGTVMSRTKAIPAGPWLPVEGESKP